VLRTKSLWLVVMIGFGGADPALTNDPAEVEGHPVYVGARVCARCHSSAATGHQYSLWRRSKHAKAYAVLWSEDAKRIAELTS